MRLARLLRSIAGLNANWPMHAGCSGGGGQSAVAAGSIGDVVIDSRVDGVPGRELRSLADEPATYRPALLPWYPALKERRRLSSASLRPHRRFDAVEW